MTHSRDGSDWRPAACRRVFAASSLVLLALAGCGSESRPAPSGERPRLRMVEGLPVVEATEPRGRLRVMAINDGLYVRFTRETPARLREELAGRPLAAVCEFDPPVTKERVGIIPMPWRREFSDWGAFPERYPPGARVLARTIRSCELLRGEPTGKGGGELMDPERIFSRVSFR